MSSIEIFKEPEPPRPDPLIVKLIPASMERTIPYTRLTKTVPIVTLCAVDSMGHPLTGGRLLALTLDGLYLFGAIETSVRSKAPDAFAHNPIRAGMQTLKCSSPLRSYREKV